MIRQAISCDICGTEKKQTNHWFVAYDQGGELRVSGWSSRNRLRPGSKHLCGQTCLHKLVDDFMARILAVRVSQPAANGAASEGIERAVGNDTTLTSNAAYEEIESSARLIPTPEPVLPSRPAVSTAPAPPLSASSVWPAARMPLELVAVPARAHAEEDVASVNEPLRYASRNWHAAAWERERERERELHAGERHPGLAARRRYN